MRFNFLRALVLASSVGLAFGVSATAQAQKLGHMTGHCGRAIALGRMVAGSNEPHASLAGQVRLQALVGRCLAALQALVVGSGTHG